MLVASVELKKIYEGNNLIHADFFFLLEILQSFLNH